jgi:hypothetical protein
LTFLSLQFKLQIFRIWVLQHEALTNDFCVNMTCQQIAKKNVLNFYFEPNRQRSAGLGAAHEEAVPQPRKQPFGCHTGYNSRRREQKKSAAQEVAVRLPYKATTGSRTKKNSGFVSAVPFPSISNVNQANQRPQQTGGELSLPMGRISPCQKPTMRAEAVVRGGVEPGVGPQHSRKDSRSCGIFLFLTHINLKF